MTIFIEHESVIMISRTPLNVTNPEHMKTLRAHARGCTELYADCEDFIAIRDQFTNIPMVDSVGMATWYGDTAKFIARNIRSPE